MPKGYLILTETIHDPEGMEAYSKLSSRSLAERNATVLIVDDRVEVLEGEWAGQRTVVVEFESVEAAKEWYDSDAYRAARPLRQAAADCNVIIASGFEPARR